jgi:hypothetical protein
VVSSALDPLNIFIVGLGGAFLIPLLNRFGRSWPAAAFLFALTAMTMISGVSLWRLSSGAAPIAILTGGADAPYAINLRIDLLEAVFAFAISVVALVGARGFARGSYSAMLLYLLLIIGIQGMVMTRDLFNLFVFLEVVSIATYGLLSLQDTPAALAAAFKYLMATVLASTFFLMGTMLLYAATGMLNIDDLIVRPQPIGGPVEFAALMFVLACLLLELKPFPANGWGLDVYETARSDVAALIAGGVSAGVFFALLKLMPLFNDKLELIAGLSGVTFVFSNLIGLRDEDTTAARLFVDRPDGAADACRLSSQTASGRKLHFLPGGRRSVRQSPACQGWLVLAGRPRQWKVSDRLVETVCPTRCNPAVGRAVGCDLRISAVPGVLGEMAARREPGSWRALCVDCHRAHWLPAGSCLPLPLVR